MKTSTHYQKIMFSSGYKTVHGTSLRYLSWITWTSFEVRRSNTEIPSKSIQLTEYLISQLEKIQNQHNSNLSLLMSAASKEALNKLLFQCHLIEHFHHLSPPDKGARAEILEVYLTQKLGCGVDFDIMDMVTETEGYLQTI